MRSIQSLVLAVLLPMLVFGATPARKKPLPAAVPTVIPQVIRTVPHDQQAFTQGLLVHRGQLYESTGLDNQSSLRVLDPADGRIVRFIPVPEVFGEGLAFRDGFFSQLTWRSSRAIRYDARDLKVSGGFAYQGEGWGLTSDSAGFVMSNGSDSLYFRGPDFSVRRRMAVTLGGRPLSRLNELEYCRGLVYANIWYCDSIAEIDTRSGAVQRIIDCSGLTMQARAAARLPIDVLNGIAYDARLDEFYLTGKNWPLIFVVRIPKK
jgi:glutamine cyclotransferase